MPNASLKSSGIWHLPFAIRRIVVVFTPRQLFPAYFAGSASNFDLHTAAQK